MGVNSWEGRFFSLVIWAVRNSPSSCVDGAWVSQLKVFAFSCFCFNVCFSRYMILGYRLLRCSSQEKRGVGDQVGVVYAFTLLSHLFSSFLCSSLAMIVGHTYKQILLGIGVW
jgi:hypothetical protein